MAKIHKPRSGSLAFYPRKRAKRETPAFKTFADKADEQAKPLNFYGYKVGMTHVIGTDTHKRSPTYGQKVAQAVTVIETPPLFIFGLRAYEKTPDGLRAIAEVWHDELPKELARRIKTLRKRFEGSAKKKETKEKSAEKSSEKKIEELAKLVSEGKVYEIRLLACTQPKLTTIGKKKPEIVEIFLSGSADKQLEYARSKLGHELSVKEVFSEKEWLDVKGVTKGKGFQGVVKRFGVKMHRPKAKERRVVGSIGPWHPATVMWTVPRPGQAGYHTRTEYNKKLLKIGEADLNPPGGWKNYGVIKNEYILVEGSIPGPAKRCVTFRKSMRPAPIEMHQIEEVEFIAAKQ
ncbi:MAG: 50S ribosomal protein L3 [Candidatus Diapherotrites archaeon]|nr:50S ribosomal protein L3 [Candidatus Diapherotrites archaeon]